MFCLSRASGATLASFLYRDSGGPRSCSSFILISSYARAAYQRSVTVLHTAPCPQLFSSFLLAHMFSLAIDVSRSDYVHVVVAKQAIDVHY